MYKGTIKVTRRTSNTWRRERVGVGGSGFAVGTSEMGLEVDEEPQCLGQVRGTATAKTERRDQRQQGGQWRPRAMGLILRPLSALRMGDARTRDRVDKPDQN